MCEQSSPNNTLNQTCRPWPIAESYFANVNSEEKQTSSDFGNATLDQDQQDEKLKLKHWCQKNGLCRYHSKIVDELGIESLDDIVQSDMNDLCDICHALEFSDAETKKFLAIVLEHKNKENAAGNELKVWCDDNKGFFTLAQLSALNNGERMNLCKQMELTYGKKTRFLTDIPAQKMKPDERTVKVVPCQKVVVKQDGIGESDICLDPDNEYDEKNNKTLMFVGETGTGKTTTINSVMNYLFNADFYGHRYELIQEAFTEKAKSESMTSDVTLYYIRPTAIDCQLTVIDTPGFGDTKGWDFDKQTTAKIKHLFETKVSEIDVIFFVIKASQSRLTERQSYVFNEVLNIFGSDIAENIILLFTFADESTPVALHCVKDGRIPHRDKFVKLNNSAFAFALHEENRARFDKSLVRFAEMFEEIETMQTKSLQLTREVLRYRNNLKWTVQHAMRKLNDGLLVYETLKKRIKYVENAHKNEATISVPSVIKVIEENKSFRRHRNRANSSGNLRDSIASQDRLLSFVVCQKCQHTCHDDTGMHMRKYSNFYDLDGRCAQCPQRCSRENHERVQYKYDSVWVEKQVDQLIKEDTAQLKECERDLIEMTMKMRVYICKIKELALNKQVLTPLDYLEDLIRAEETQREKGYVERVKALQSIQKQQELLTRISADVNQRDINSLFPEFADIYQYQQEQEEQKEAQSRRKNAAKSKRYSELYSELCKGVVSKSGESWWNDLKRQRMANYGVFKLQEHKKKDSGFIGAVRAVAPWSSHNCKYRILHTFDECQSTKEESKATWKDVYHDDDKQKTEKKFRDFLEMIEWRKNVDNSKK